MKLNIGDSLHLKLDLYINIYTQPIEYDENEEYEFKETLDHFIHAYFNKQEFTFIPYKDKSSIDQ